MRAIASPAVGNAATSRAWGMFVFATALLLPVSVRAACHPARSSARSTLAVRSLVDRINARGLRYFARSHQRDARNEWSGSPVLDWYFDAIESGSALAARPVGAQAFIVGLSRAGVDVSGKIWAVPARNTYSAAVATELARNFCVRTTWEKLAATGRRFQRWRKAHVPQISYFLEIDGTPSVVLLASIKSGIPRIPAQFVGKLPFYASGGVRGARVDGRAAKTVLYLFWGNRDALTSFRETLDLARWKSIRKAFHPTIVSLSNVAYRRLYAFSREAPSSVFLGATAMPQYPFQRGVAGSGLIQLGSRGAMVEVGEGVVGTLTISCIPMKPKGRICPGVDWITYNTLPAKKYRFSAVVPMLYVIVERQTGAILLLGAHG